MAIEENRRPLFAKALPDIRWKSLGARIRIEPDLEQLRTYSVYRYASIAEALALCNGQMSLARPRSWPDKYESHVTDKLFNEKGPFAATTPYMKCFSVEYSSEAMWRTYAGAGGLVRIGIKLFDLIEGLGAARWSTEGKIYIGRARYMEQAAILKAVDALAAHPPKGVMNNAMSALLMKRAGFSYENEIRIGFFAASRKEPPDIVSASRFPVEKIGRVLLDPYLPGWQAGELVALFKKRLRVKFPVQQSSFDTNPKAGT